jgi:MFS family permease
LAGLSLAGWLIERFGSAQVTTRGALASVLTLPLLGLAPHPVVLWLALAASGVAISVTDVAMNTQGVAVEDRYGRPVLSSLHGLFSVGGLVGAAFGGLMAFLDLTPVLHFLLAAALLGGLVVFAAPRLLPTVGTQRGRRPVFVRPSRALLGLGVVAFCSTIGEGSMADWSAVYLDGTLNAGPGLAAAGYAAYSLLMAAGRLTGDRLNERFGPMALVRSGGGLAAGGLGLALLAAHPAAAIVGFACVGAGLSSIIPLVFSAAGRTPGMSSGSALAAVATVGYAGFLAGPPVIGVLAELISLRGALLAVLGACLVIAWQAAAVRRTETA